MMKTRFTVCCCALWILMLLSVSALTGCSDGEKAIPDEPMAIKGLTFSERAELVYADQFAIDRYEGGYSMIYVADGGKYMVVPQGETAPKGLPDNVKVIESRTGNIYLAATAVMGLFDAIGCGDAIGFSGTKAEDWFIPYAKEAMEQGDILYAGKYREPDYELLIENGCKLSIQSTMIEHTPEVKEKLTELGITVFVDYSSYEAHPLGRSEWIKVYAELMGKQDEAVRLFDEQVQELESVSHLPSTNQTVVYFYISNAGQAVTRKSGDYVSKMIELAGGKNIFEKLRNDNQTSAVTMEMEEFYTTAKDADIMIYNTDISGDINSIEELIAKNGLLADFKSVKEGHVWCTRHNLFQETMKLGAVISDFHAIFSDTTEEHPPQFLYRLEREAAQ